MIVFLCSAASGIASVTLTEGTVLGGGAFSRVSIVTEETTGRQYALKRMRKSAVVAVPGARVLRADHHAQHGAPPSAYDSTAPSRCACRELPSMSPS